MVKNKKGFSVTEILVAIAVIGIGAATLCTSILATMNSTVRAESYTLAEQIAQTYSTLASKCVVADKVIALNNPDETRDADGKLVSLEYKTITVAGPTDDNKTACADFFGADSGIYKALYAGEGTMTLNGIGYDASVVSISVEKKSKGTGSIGMYGMHVTVSYMGREVTYDSTNMYKK